MDNEHAQERADYIAALHVEHTKDEFGQDRWFVADIHEDWIEGPYDTRDLAWAYIARCHRDGKVVAEA